MIFHPVGARANCPTCDGATFIATPYKVASIVGSTGGASVQKLPTDPIGSATLTLTNVVSGSALEIEDSTDGTSLYIGTVSGSSDTVALNVYSAGSTRNTVRVKVRKGSASPYYQPFETIAALAVGSQSIYVNQLPDE